METPALTLADARPHDIFQSPTKNCYSMPSPAKALYRRRRCLRDQLRSRLLRQGAPMWQSVSTAPFDRDLELAVIDSTGEHALVFPCRRVLHGWVNSKTGSPVQVHPTHWRGWAPVATEAADLPTGSVASPVTVQS